MPRPPALGSEDNGFSPDDHAGSVPGQPSGTRLSLSLCAPENIRVSLPETLLEWLYHGMDRRLPEEISESRVQKRHFEAAIVDRLFPIYDARTFVIRMRDHCRATALAARVVSERVGLSCSDRAFVVGWLHDMGVAEHLRQLVPKSLDTENDEFDRLWPDLLYSASASAVSLATAWRLPRAIRHAIREHMSFDTIRPVHEVAATTFIAEHLAGCMGCSFRDEQPTSGLHVALARLRLSERDLVSLGRSAERLLAREAWYYMGVLPRAGA